MADEKLITSELNIFFNEQGQITMGGGLHVKVLLPGTATVKTIQALVDRVHEYRDSQPEPDECPPDERGTPAQEQRMVVPPDVEGPAQSGNRPPGGASEAQCKKILAVCHRLDDNTVIEVVKNYPGAEWRLDKDGHCLPDWNFLQSLTKYSASNVIERLERAEA